MNFHIFFELANKYVIKHVEYVCKSISFILENKLCTGNVSSVARKGHANLNGKGSWLLPKTEISEGLMFELERGRLQRVQVFFLLHLGKYYLG